MLDIFRMVRRIDFSEKTIYLQFIDLFSDWRENCFAPSLIRQTLYHEIEINPRHFEFTKIYLFAA